MVWGPALWRRRINGWCEEHRAIWYAYWRQDLPLLRINYPELAHWNDRELIAAIADFHHMILDEGDIETTRNLRFLEWLRLSCTYNQRLDKDAFFREEQKLYS